MREGCTSAEQYSFAKNAAIMDAQIMHRKEEYARSMGQYTFAKSAAMMGAQIMYKREESAGNMGQNLFSKNERNEESAEKMGQ